jgi:hypothetical protein
MFIEGMDSRVRGNDKKSGMATMGS